MLPGSLVKDEHLGLRIPYRDLHGSRESLLVRTVCMAAGVVIEIITVTVDDEYHRVGYSECTLIFKQSFLPSKRNGAARQ
jgi:hypothetical protein